MNASRSSPDDVALETARWRRAPRGLVAAGWLVLAGVLAYANSFSVPFLFDDLPSIMENPSLHRLWPPGNLIAGQPGGLTTSGRPVVALTLASNYALTGEHAWSYHAVNLAIHLAAGLCLLGIVRRTWLRYRPHGDTEHEPAMVAFAVAGIWLLHPLQTESVTYIVQRAESLAGLFFLLTLYAFIRGTEAGASGSRPAAVASRFRPAARGWFLLSVVTCWLGMATKEVVAAAPLLVLLYDRTFVAGSFGGAWRARRGLHLGLAGSWILLAALVVGTASRGGTAGFDAPVSSWEYVLTQARAIAGYLRLSLWPHPLVFDYGTATAGSLGEVFLPGLLVLGLLAGTAIALWRWPAVGFVGAWFFALLGPSSSFVPVATQTMAEHRMYLPLAAVVILFVLGGRALLGDRARWLWLGVALACGGLTWARNLDYQSDRAIWEDTVAKVPGNARAHNNLGRALFREGRVLDSIESYRRALALQAEYPETLYNLGVSLADLGRLNEAIAHYEAALRIEPAYPEAHNNLGNALVRSGRLTEAMGHYQQALAHQPGFAEAHHNQGDALLQLGRPAEAAAHFERALELKPDYAEARYNMGNAFAAREQMPRALEEYRRALELRPDYAEAHVNAGNALLALDRPAEAIMHYQRAIALAPGLADAHFNLGSVLLQMERWDDAIPPLERALQASPGLAGVHRALGFALARTGRPDEAMPHYEAYLRAEPGDDEARAELALLKGARD